MKKKWEKLIAVWCAAVMFMTMPGVGVLADVMREEDELIVEKTEVPKDPVESVDPPVEGVTESIDASIKEDASSPEAAEEVVGEGTIQVGDGVTATFDANTGAVEFYSQDGELWRNWDDRLGYSIDKIKSIRVASGTVFLPEDSSYIFSYNEYIQLSNLTNLDLSNFDTSNVTNMSHMFYHCSDLTNLDLSSFDTSNVTNMRRMFWECSSLTELDLSSFNTLNVTDMRQMFWECSSLIELDLSSFNTSNVTSMGYMFSGCNILANLDLSSFNTSNVEYMGDML